MLKRGIGPEESADTLGGWRKIKMKGFAEGLRRLISTFEEADTDLYAYAGPIDRAGYQKLCRSIPKKDRRSNALLVLCTRGGDPHAGYRIARALIHHYTSQNC